MDSKILTFLQQSTKARESVAVCEKMENELDSMEAEVEDLKKSNSEVPGTVVRLHNPPPRLREEGLGSL